MNNSISGRLGCLIFWRKWPAMVITIAAIAAVVAPAASLAAPQGAPLAIPWETHEAEEDQHVRGRVLGSLSFPTTSKVPEAQQAFVEGMLFLHLFEYPHAREAFQRAQDLEPGFAMAFWGEAMTHNAPIWDEQDLVSARAVLARLGATPEARRLSTPAAREIGLLSAVEALYGGGGKSDRDRLYLQLMEQLAAQFPEDHEIQLFYALSILGVSAGVRDVPSYMMATAIAQAVFSENPRHPGAAHYLIHGVDDPVHAVLGVAAARALSEIAPDAGHSLHMTSHIFTALGMWDDVVNANQRAVGVQNRLRLELAEAQRQWGHYNFWLLYGYLQQGKHEQARALLLAARAQERQANAAPEDRMILVPDRSLSGSVVQMWFRYLVETRQWDSDIANWSFNIGEAFDPNLNYSFVQSIRAAYAGQGFRRPGALGSIPGPAAGIGGCHQGDGRAGPDVRSVYSAPGSDAPPIACRHRDGAG